MRRLRYEQADLIAACRPATGAPVLKPDSAVRFSPTGRGEDSFLSQILLCWPPPVSIAESRPAPTQLPKSPSTLPIAFSHLR
jgi:hypothetical protein